MRRSISILILALIFTHLIGFYAYFAVRLGQIRNEMRETISLLPPDQFVVFTLTPAEYEQVKVDDHEVKMDGRMYDHSSPKFENGKVILYAKHDEAEDNLLALLEEVVDTHTSDDQPIPGQLFSFFNLIYVAPTPTLVRSAQLINPTYFTLTVSLLDRTNSVLEHPPRI